MSVAKTSGRLGRRVLDYAQPRRPARHGRQLAATSGEVAVLVAAMVLVPIEFVLLVVWCFGRG